MLVFLWARFHIFDLVFNLGRWDSHIIPGFDLRGCVFIGGFYLTWVLYPSVFFSSRYSS